MIEDSPVILLRFCWRPAQHLHSARRSWRLPPVAEEASPRVEEERDSVLAFYSSSFIVQGSEGRSHRLVLAGGPTVSLAIFVSLLGGCRTIIDRCQGFMTREERRDLI